MTNVVNWATSSGVKRTSASCTPASECFKTSRLNSPKVSCTVLPRVMANSWVLRTAQRRKCQFLALLPQHKTSTAGKLSSHSDIAISGTYGEGCGSLFLIQPVLFAKHENPQIKIHEDGIFCVGFVVGQAELGRDKCERCVGLRCCDGDNRGRRSSTEESSQMQRVL